MHADDASGVATAPAVLSSDSADVFVASACVRAADLLERGEQLLLRRELLDDRLDDDVAIGEVGDVGRRGEEPDVVAGDLPLLDLAREEVVDRAREPPPLAGHLASDRSRRPASTASCAMPARPIHPQPERLRPSRGGDSPPNPLGCSHEPPSRPTLEPRVPRARGWVLEQGVALTLALQSGPGAPGRGAESRHRRCTSHIGGVVAGVWPEPRRPADGSGRLIRDGDHRRVREVRHPHRSNLAPAYSSHRRSDPDEQRLAECQAERVRQRPPSRPRGFPEAVRRRLR